MNVGDRVICRKESYPASNWGAATVKERLGNGYKLKFDNGKEGFFFREDLSRLPNIKNRENNNFRNGT